MKHAGKHLSSTAAACCAAVLAAVSMPASAEADTPPMAFRLDAEQKYVTQGRLEEGDLIIPAQMYIDNYSGISILLMHLLSDEPLHIENGDFTRDPERQEVIGRDPETNELLYADKQCFFESYADARYTQYSEETELENVVLWYSPGWIENEVGKLDTPESSFLHFDVRIPQGTPAGQYRCYFATGDRPAPGGKTTPELYLRSGSEDLAESIVLTPLTITVEPAALRGDVNCDGSVDAADAQLTLQYYVTMLASGSVTDDRTENLFGTPYIHTALEAADINTDGDVQADDAQRILKYYVERLAGKEAEWEDLIGPGAAASDISNAN